MNRRTHTLLPSHRVLRKPTIPSNTEQELHNSKQKQRLNHNQQARDLSNLDLGTTVRIQRLGTRQTWTKARVEERLPHRSYRVKTEDGRILRRNRRHFRATKETFRETAPFENVFEDWQQSPVVYQAETRTETEERDKELHRAEVREEPVYNTCYGRASKPPKRFCDWVYHQGISMHCDSSLILCKIVSIVGTIIFFF